MQTPWLRRWCDLLDRGRRGRYRGIALASAKNRLSSGAPAIALALALIFCWSVETSAADTHALKAIWGPATRNGVSLFPIYKDLGDQLYQDSLRWDLIAPRRPAHPRNPNDPAYAWPAEVTSALAQAKRYHM